MESWIAQIDTSESDSMNFMDVYDSNNACGTETPACICAQGSHTHMEMEGNNYTHVCQSPTLFDLQDTPLTDAYNTNDLFGLEESLNTTYLVDMEDIFLPIPMITENAICVASSNVYPLESSETASYDNDHNALVVEDYDEDSESDESDIELPPLSTMPTCVKVARWLENHCFVKDEEDTDDTASEQTSDDESESDSKPLMMDRLPTDPDENKKKALANIFGRTSRVFC